MEFRHKAHLSQTNKSHKKNRSKSGGKIETKIRTLISSSHGLVSKDQRFNMQNEARKLKREEMIMKRRGLNFISDAAVENLDDQSVSVLEQEVDNVAPKIVGILGLNSACDISGLRAEMIKYCCEYQQTLNKSKHDKNQVEEVNIHDDQFKAYLCPNPGSSNNFGSKKQRLIFLEINRDDDNSVLEVGKIADLIVVVMSCSESDSKGLKVDPDRFSNAIDEQGYKALSLLRSSGLPGLIGVLQHLERQKSSKQPQLRKLFQRYFESEFTNRHKFMNINLLNSQTDVNALLRQIAVIYPEDITWRQNRSYMLGKLSQIQNNELHVEGYIRQNFLNAKRLIHITGVNSHLAFKIKRIEIASDPCPMKISSKEKEKIMSTSKAQSIVQSRKASRKGSMDDVSQSASVAGDNVGRVIQLAKDLERDPASIENNPGLFCAEQTWPTEEEMKSSKQSKKTKQQDDDDMQLQQAEHMNLESSYPVAQVKTGLEEMFDRMEIKVIGGKNEDNKSEKSMEDLEDDDDEDDLNNTMYQDDNKIGGRHFIKFQLYNEDQIFLNNINYKIQNKQITLCHEIIKSYYNEMQGDNLFIFHCLNLYKRLIIARITFILQLFMLFYNMANNQQNYINTDKMEKQNH